jgi:hypothetical protein
LTAKTTLVWHNVAAAMKKGNPGARKKGIELWSGYEPVEQRVAAAER